MYTRYEVLPFNVQTLSMAGPFSQESHQNTFLNIYFLEKHLMPLKKHREREWGAEELSWYNN
jgi:hypothetical protein